MRTNLYTYIIEMILSSIESAQSLAAHESTTVILSLIVFLPAMNAIVAMNFENTKNTSAKYCHMNDYSVCQTPSPNSNSCSHCQCLANDLASDSTAYIPDHFVSEPHFAVETNDALFSFSSNVFYVNIFLFRFLLFYLRKNTCVHRKPFTTSRRWPLLCYLRHKHSCTFTQNTSGTHSSH